MVISSKLFLCENNPQKNLEILANFSVSSASNTNCTTENAYKKLPKTSISPGTLREISIVSTIFTVAGLPFTFIAKKGYECASLFGNAKMGEFNTCRLKILDTLAEPVNIMTYLSFLSGVAILGMGAYAAARLLFQDKTKGERFELLDREYSAAAIELENRYRTAGKEEKEKIVRAALQLSSNAKLINASLEEVAHLSASQANLLTAKISHAAQSIILHERTATLYPARLEKGN